MMVLVSYDVSTSTPGGTRRLRQAAKACLDYGQRVQNSVFECEIDPAQWTILRNRLEDIIDPKKDSLRFYFLGSKRRRKIEHVGAKPTVDLGEDPLIV
jgi:CRISPR-associated protein Cas2